VKENGWWDQAKDKLIIFHNKPYDYNGLQRVAVYEPYFKTMSEVLQLENDDPENIKIGLEWWMSLNRTKLAIEVVQLIRISQQSRNNANYRSLCPN